MSNRYMLENHTLSVFDWRLAKLRISCCKPEDPAGLSTCSSQLSIKSFKICSLMFMLLSLDEQINRWHCCICKCIHSPTSDPFY